MAYVGKKLGKPYFHYDFHAVFKHFTKKFKDTKEKHSKKINRQKSIEELKDSNANVNYEKALELMKKNGIIDKYFKRLSALLLETENEIHFRVNCNPKAK